MIFFIDAYNVLKTSYSHISNSVKTRFINQIVTFCKKNNHTAYLVFDGYSQENYANFQRLKIIYSGYDSADDYILEKIQVRSTQEKVIVSYDRKLIQLIKVDCIVMEPADFIKIISDENRSVNQLDTGTQIKKTTDLLDENLDELMSGLRVIKKQEIQEDLGYGRKLSKEEKKQQALFKKIIKK